jgi:S-DNA-T family DNA segregation ATPase FtsK/SpoIIIE
MNQNNLKRNIPRNTPRNGTADSAPNSDKKETSKKKDSKKSFWQDKRNQVIIGFAIIMISLILLASFISYLFTGKADQSVVQSIFETGVRESGSEVANFIGLLGAFLAHIFMYKWFGIAGFFIPPLLFLWGVRLAFRRNIANLSSLFRFSTFAILWIDLVLGYIAVLTNEKYSLSYISGGIGYELAYYLHALIGGGLWLLILFFLLTFIVYFFNVTSLLALSDKVQEMKEKTVQEVAVVRDAANRDLENEEETDSEDINKQQLNADNQETLFSVTRPEDEEEVAASLFTEIRIENKKNIQKEPSFVIETNPSEAISESEVAVQKQEEQAQNEDDQEFNADVIEDLEIEDYDPTSELSRYQNPNADLLNNQSTGKPQVTQEELEQNKDKIVETLLNYGIGIDTIKATVGPTVTLYEIIPKAGIRISKIKSLEDDIALSLAALGIRIIAPIPGQGTIGIEVPNKNREVVSMRSVIMSEKFQKNNKELPIILGKTISNEIFIADLTEMPHLLVAGATGQGKSVGINVILTSLLYKKHPAHLKFVLVDPKKVELSIYSRIEKHYLAKLPENEESIITDTKKVVYTLNSLCIEMDNRYDLLKEAGCRNIKEYNAKFISRRLNPEKGHRFFPYIVLVIDELADLMMTAGKEVEQPIARLAQLARAIGIHLIVATQRPSVNVITGIIKANFPARLSFKVTSKIDSRTILDAGGAEQLVGKGDMLLSLGSNIIRLQCPFVDTDEVERICESIGKQPSYASAYYLPEFIGENGDGNGGVDAGDTGGKLDELFEESARIVVTSQTGSASLLQRKLQIGYARAGRILDQLERAGIVGPFEGSKSRRVNIPDHAYLEQLLREIRNR